MASPPVTLVALSHRTAPLEVLERVASTRRAPAAAEEWVTVRTCNRAEFYIAGQQATAVAADLRAALSHETGIAPDQLAAHVYALEGLDVARHAMRVGTGLDSLVVGEAQILGQLTRALEEARGAGTAGPVLTRLFGAAVQAGRRARAETEVGRYPASVSSAAVQLAASALGALAGRRALVIGAGEAAELAARALAGRGVGTLVCCSRTEAHSREVAASAGGSVLAWEHLAAGLAVADVVISATSAPEPVVRAEQLAPLRAGGRPLVLVDLAVPHDVEPDVAALPGVRLYGIEDLRSVTDEGLARRRAAAPAVEAIVEDELERFRRWMAGFEVAPVIVELRRHVHRAVHAEARAGLDRVGRGEVSPEEALQRLAERITTKVLHVPVARLRERAALDGAEDSIAVIRDLFDIDSASEEEAA